MTLSVLKVIKLSLLLNQKSLKEWFNFFQIICIWVVMHHASCPGAPPPIRPSTHSKATGHSCHSNNKNSTTAYCPPLRPPSATPRTPVKKHLTLIPIPTPHLPKFSHLAINVDWWVISSSTIQHHVTMYCAAYIMIFSQKYCCISPSLASIVAPSSLQVSCPPVKKISHNIGSRCAKSFIVLD